MPVTFRGPLVSTGRKTTGIPAVTVATGYATGDVLIVYCARDPGTVATGADGSFSTGAGTISDSAGNSYIRAGGYRIGATAATAGVAVELFYSQLTAPLNAGLGNLNYNVASSVPAKAMVVAGFTGVQTGVATLAASTGSVQSGTTGLSASLAGLNPQPYLWLYAAGIETSVNNIAPSASGWALQSGNQAGTSGSSAGTNILVSANYDSSTDGSGITAEAVGSGVNANSALIVVALKDRTFAVGAGAATGIGDATGATATIISAEGHADGRPIVDENGAYILDENGDIIFDQTPGGFGFASGVGTGVAGAFATGVGAASGTGAATGVGVTVLNASGAAAGTGTASGVGALTAASSGAAAGTGAATGIGVTIIAASGAAAGTGQATGIGAYIAATSGLAAGTGAATGVGVTVLNASGAAAGTGTATAIGAQIAAASGAAAGAGTATAAGAQIAAASGAATGIGTATGIGAYIAAAAGLASGTGAAMAVTEQGAAVGASSGTAAATGIGATPDFNYLRPDADDATGTWTNQSGGAALFPSIDETAETIDDADYIQSATNPSADICRFRLSNPVYNGIVPPGKLRIRYKRDGAGNINLAVRLKEGTTQIAERVISGLPADFFTDTLTLTTGEFSSITDFDNLFVELQADAA